MLSFLTIFTADNQLNAKLRLSKYVRMQHFRFHKEDAINVNKVNPRATLGYKALTINNEEIINTL